jgi:hypothetical protein
LAFPFPIHSSAFVAIEVLTMSTSKMTRPFPKFSELPLDPTHPPHSAWGLWGPDDELGTLNHLTSERTVEAAKLIRTGTRVGLSWPLEQMDYAGEDFRQVLKHEIYELGKNMNVGIRLRKSDSG